MEVIFQYFSPEEKIKIIKATTIEISEDSLNFLSNADRKRLLQISNTQKKIEFVAGRMCASMVIGGNLHYECNQNQPPSVEKGYLSISHTRGYAAAAYHPCRKIGIDIELSDRSVKNHVLKRYASEYELTQIQSTFDALRLWCAKEAVFKAGHMDGLEFREHIHINWFNHETGNGYIRNGISCKSYAIRQLCVNDLLSVYAVEQ